MSKNPILKDNLTKAKTASQDAPYKFALVLKGGTSGALIVAKAIKPADITQAKKETGGSAVVEGVCYKGGEDFVFQTEKEPLPNWTTVVKKIAHEEAELTISPKFIQKQVPSGDGGPKKTSSQPSPERGELGPKESSQAWREQAEREAEEFVRQYIIEHGTLPKWAQLLKDPKFARAVALQDELIRTQAAVDILNRKLHDKQLMQKIMEERESVKKVKEVAKKQLGAILEDKSGPPDIEKCGPVLRQGVSSLSPAVAEKFRIADEVCMKLFGHPVQIKPPPSGMTSPISYKDGVIYLSSGCPRAQLIGGIIFELNNAVKAGEFKKIETDWESNKIMEAEASEYGITDPDAAEIFKNLKTPAERRALAQEYLEWEHMMNGTIREQQEVSTGMSLGESDSGWANYITSMCPGATNGTWNTFKGYISDKDGNAHYQIVLNAIRGTKEKEPESKQGVEEPKLDLSAAIKDGLKLLRTPVPEGKLNETIEHLIHLVEKNGIEMDSLEGFVRNEAKKFTSGEFVLQKRDFDEEKWKEWKKG
jgi:hypothetical protein